MSKKASDRISKKKKKNKLSNYYITLETNFLVFRHPTSCLPPSEHVPKITTRRILKLPDRPTKCPTKPSNHSNKTNFLVFRHLNLGDGTSERERDRHSRQGRPLNYPSRVTK